MVQSHSCQESVRPIASNLPRPAGVYKLLIFRMGSALGPWSSTARQLVDNRDFFLVVLEAGGPGAGRQAGRVHGETPFHLQVATSRLLLRGGRGRGACQDKNPTVRAALS